MNDFTYIIVGAGSAGCVLASRLTENPDTKVLLLEEGPDDASLLIRMPKGNGKTLQSGKYTAYHPTTRQLASGTETWVRGKVLGGSSSVNGMVWIRGQPEDYDRLASLGNPGWGWHDLAPYFRKLEDHALGGSDARGVGGPVKVKIHPPSPLGDAFIGSGTVLGLRRKRDLNVADQEGIGYLSMNIDARGRRCSAAHAFLKPIRHRSNLKTLTGVRVDKLLLENRRAVGVAGVRNGQLVEFRAKGGVILSAGTIATPKILQLSGIGPANHLRSRGLEVVHDAPGVGQNLREHLLLTLNYGLKNAAHSQNGCFSGIGLVKSVAQYMFSGRGPLGNSSYTAGAFVRSDPHVDRPDGQLMFAPWTRDPVTKIFGPAAGMNVFSYQLRPVSTGSVLVGSADPALSPLVSPNYLAKQEDRDCSVALIHYLRRLMATRPVADFVTGETEETRWAQTHDEIINLFRQRGSPGYHNCGTVAMGRGPGAVLDERLRVRGIDGLRVMDLSVLPELLSGNTNAPVMAMAWRAADLFIEDDRRPFS